MLFPTTVFAAFFLVVFLGNWLLQRHRKAWLWFLLGSSYVFYGWWDWRFLFLILFSTVCNHLAAVQIGKAGIATGGTATRRHRLWLIAAVVVNLGLLGFFKYYGFFVQSAYRVLGSFGVVPDLPLLDIVLPVGISFFTFQAMSYVMDVYRGAISPAGSLLEFGVYLAFFPQLVAGPIVRAKVFLPQLMRGPRKRVEVVNTGRAAVLILGGLFKKVVLANTLAQVLADPVFSFPEAYGARDSLLGVYGYALQIYCDFAAYSDIAIGVALLLGFSFPDNFRAPYLAVSFRDFWRRWHISLSTWLRDYLYIPLGGSRHGTWRTQRNLVLTFLLGGLWHGASWRFVAWGALHGTYLVAERWFVYLLGPRVGAVAVPRWMQGAGRWIARLIVLHGVCLSWVFFRAETFADGWMLLGNLGDWHTPSTLMSMPIVAIMVLAYLIQFMDGEGAKWLEQWYNRRSPYVQGALAGLVLTVILGMGPRGVAPFIYFQF